MSHRKGLGFALLKILPEDLSLKNVRQNIVILHALRKSYTLK